ncbi:phage portal protein [Actinomadura alba]|uniref:Phage portal protein n=1 Tax=Actinomadura alba TaxID=406431 RepID=A0ABR7LI48_9ACTN|nr:phage portal protein [Actinomadura alba]MBC6464264.1 phage portal protein [Actinomadura alba]
MSLFGLFESRANPNNPAVPLTSSTLLDWLGMGEANESGVPVNQNTAMNLSAVYRAVDLVSSVSAALPLVAYRSGTKQPAPAPLLAEPHPDLTPYEFWKLSYVHRLLWADSFSRIVTDRVGRPRQLWPLHPSRVQVKDVQPSEANPEGKVFVVDGEEDRPLTSRDIFHIPGLSYDGLRGVSVITHARQSMGLGLAAERYGARFFGKGSLLSGILRTEQRLDQGQADDLKSRWREKMAGIEHSHEVAVLDSGAQFQPLSMPHDDAQFLESRQFQTEEIARWFGVPPFLLMLTEKSTSWGTGLEQQTLAWLKFTLHPTWLTPTEQRATRRLTDGGVEVRYKVRELLRGDSTARAAFYRTMRELGTYNGDDIRDEEDLPPLPDGLGAEYWQPANMVPLGTRPQIQGDDDEPTGQPAD